MYKCGTEHEDDWKEIERKGPGYDGSTPGGQEHQPRICIKKEQYKNRREWRKLN